MSITVTKTKLHVPRRRADLLSRPRLNSTLVDLLDYPFTLISAPAGYGKTSLMIDLACQASHPVCWYSIDPLDREPKRFLAHLIWAIKEEFPDFGKPSLDLLGNLNDPFSVPGQFVATLVNDIYSSISENFALFLDDFHLLEDHPKINEFISLFGQQMDENTHLVLSSRKLFNFPDLPLLIGRKLVRGIDQDDLAFQPHELREYFQSVFQLSLSAEESAEMVKNTAGWITGLLLGKETGKKLLPDQHKASKIAGADLGSYFADQVYLKQPEPVRNLMLRTSYLDAFNETFCFEVFGKPESISYADFINTLMDQNLFIEQVEDNGIWIRYHHLFKEYLNQELEKKLPGEQQHLLGRLVEIHLNSRRWENAFDAAQKLNDPHLMAEVIDTASSPLFHAGRIKLLAAWLDVLPEEGYQAFPVLYPLKGFAFTELGNPALALIEINKVIDLNLISSDPILISKTLVWRSTANRLLGKYNEGITDSLMAVDLLSAVPDMELIKAEAFREIGLGNGRLGNNDKALDYLNESLSIYKKEKKENNLAQVQMDIGLILLNMGHYQEAENNLTSTIPHWTDRGNNAQLSMLMNNLGYLSSLTGNHSKATEWLKQGDKHSRLTSNMRMQAFMAASRGDLSKSLNLYERSITSYKESQRYIEDSQDSFLLSYLPVAKATCHRSLLNIAEAEDVLTHHRKSIFKGKSQFEHGLWHLEWGYTNLIQDKLETASKSFQKARQIFSGANRPNELAKSLLGLAMIANKKGETKPFKSSTDELANLLTRVETRQPLLPEFSRHLDAFQQIAASLPDQEIFQICVKEVIKYLEDLPELQEKVFPQTTVGSEIPSLEIRALGETSVLQAGKSISAPEWIHQRTAREIFFFLLSHPRGVTKEQVGLAFWPDSSPNQLSCQFKNAMYRLRRAIGKETIRFHQETRSYSFNRDCQYTYDVESFHEYIRQSESQPDEGRRVEYLQKAAAVYKHPFAPQLGGTWVEPLRRKFYLNYENAQLEIAAYELKTGNYTACRDACLSVLEIEPCQEKAYQFCMKAYSSLNNMTDLHRLFIRCESNFNEFLGIRPSNSTLNLYKDLSNI